MSFNLRFKMALLVVLLSAGCGGGGSGGRGGSSGGSSPVLAITSGPAAGTSVVANPNGVSGGGGFQAALVGDLAVPGFKPAGPAIQLTMTGGTLVQAATLTLPFEASEVPSGKTAADLAILHKRTDGTFELIAITARNATTDLLTGSITTLGTFQVVSAVAPTVSGVGPSMGPTSGGTLVTITGSGFTQLGLGHVLFGSTEVVIDSIDAAGARLTCLAPPAAAGVGLVDVSVVTSGGAARAANAFTYSAAAQLAAITPNEGPAAGGVRVTVFGANFTAASTVTIGGAAATAPTFINASQIQVTLPAGSTGTADVAVDTPGVGRAMMAHGFLYLGAPTISSIDQIGGTLGGGTLVRISGSGFQAKSAAGVDRTQVTFGGNAVQSVAFVSDSFLIVTTRPYASAVSVAVDVTVSTSGGSATATGAFRFLADTTALQPHASDSFGRVLAIADVTGDGLPDLIVGEPGATAMTYDPATAQFTPRMGAGRVLIEPGDGKGNFDRTQEREILQDVGQAPRFGQAGPGFGFGSSIAIADVNGDGHPDLIVGAPSSIVLDQLSMRLVNGATAAVLTQTAVTPVLNPSGIPGSLSTTLTFDQTLAATTTLLLEAQGTFGSVTQSLTMNVYATAADYPGQLVTLDVDNSVIVGGETATLSWSIDSNLATQFQIDTADGTSILGSTSVTNQNANGFLGVTPAATTTYVLRAIGTGSPYSQSITVNVIQKNATPTVSQGLFDSITSNGFNADPHAVTPGAVVHVTDSAFDEARQCGEVFVYLGSASGIADHALPAQRIREPFFQQDASFGASLAEASINGDAFQDLYIGAPGASGVSDGAPFSGTIYAFEGAASSVQSLGWVAVFPSESDAGFGGVIAAGDFDGDGSDDVAGAELSFGAGSGRVFVSLFQGAGRFQTPIEVALDPAYESLQVQNLRFGAALAAGDFNGDGIADLVIGAPGASSFAELQQSLSGPLGSFQPVFGGGQAFVFLSLANGTFDQGLPLEINGSSGFGSAIVVGDINGDGKADIAVSDSEGNVAAFASAGASGSAALLSFEPYALVSPEGASAGEGSGFGLTMACGDVNGDGKSDLAIAAPNAAVSGLDGAGEVAISLGPIQAAAVEITSFTGAPGSLQWATQNATQCFLNGVRVPVSSGGFGLPPGSTTTVFTLSASGGGGPVTRTITLTAP